MTCELCRESLSARLDGERPAVDDPDLQQHLKACVACRRWNEAAVSVTRSLRIAPATPVPDLTESILAAAAPVESAASPTGRIPLAIVGALQLLLGVAQLVGMDHTSHLGMAGAEHLFNESAAWNLALGLGFLAAAFRPALARGLLPALTAFIAVLTVVSVIDAVNGTVDQARLVGHCLIVIGLVMLFLVDRRSRRDPRDGTPAARSRPAGPVGSRPTPAGATEGSADDPTPNGRRLRATGWRRAA